MSADANLPVPKDNALSSDERRKRIQELKAELSELAGVPSDPAAPIVSERTTRGYRVRCSVPVLTEEERKARQAVTLEALAQALKELRQ
jgi:hypothetical protein